MTDISKCKGGIGAIICPLRDKCYRYKAPENELYQSYAPFYEYLKTDEEGKVSCEHQWLD